MGGNQILVIKRLAETFTSKTIMPLKSPTTSLFTDDTDVTVTMIISFDASFLANNFLLMRA